MWWTVILIILSVLTSILYLHIGIKVTGISRKNLEFLDIFDATIVIDTLLWPLYLVWIGMIYLYALPEQLWNRLKKKKEKA